MMGHWFGWGFGGFGGGWIMFLIMILFLGLVIWGIIPLVRRTDGSSCCGPVSQHSDSALEILKSRYAKGEIGKDEFEEKKKTLS
jgi:putative membrane protein